MKKLRSLGRRVGRDPVLLVILIVVVSAAWLSILSNNHALPHTNTDTANSTANLNGISDPHSKLKAESKVEGAQTAQDANSPGHEPSSNANPQPQPVPQPHPNPPPPIPVEPDPMPIDPPPICQLMNESSKPNLCHWPPCQPCMERMCPLNAGSSAIRYPCYPCLNAPSEIGPCRLGGDHPEAI